MDNEDRWCILNNYLQAFTEDSFIRTYSDGSVSVSMYIKEKQLNIDGYYDYVLQCIQELYREYHK